MGELLLKTSFDVKKVVDAFYTGGQVQISSEGDELFCTCGDAINSVNVKNGEKIAQYKDDGDDISCFCLSPDNQFLVTATKSLLLHQFGRTDKQVKKRWKATHKTPVLCMTYDGTSTLLATGSSDTTIKIYDTSKQYFTHNFKGTGEAISIMKFHPDSNKMVLFSSSANGKIRLWDLETSKCISILEGHFSHVAGLEFSRDYSTLISSGRDKVLIFWDLRHRKQLKTVPVFEHIEAITLVEKKINNEKQECIVTAGETGCLRLWSVPDGKCLYVDKNYKTCKENIEKEQLSSSAIVQLLKNKKEIIAVTYDHNLLFYSIKHMKQKKQLIGYYDEIVDLKYYGVDEQSIAIATNSEQIKIVDCETTDANILYGHTGTVLCLDVSYDGKYIASSSKDNTIRVWCYNEETEQFCCVGVGKGHTHWVGCVAWPKLTTDFLISGSQDLTIKSWSLPQLILKEDTIDLSVKWTEKAHDKDINAVAISPNDKIVASASQDKTVKLWKRKSGQFLGTLRGHKRGVWSLAFSPVDQCVATGSADSLVKIWSLSDYTCLKTLEGHSNSVLRVSFLCKGMQIISSSSEGLIKLWNVHNDECVATFEGHDDKIWALAISKSEENMVTGGADSSIKFWKDVTELLLLEEVKRNEETIQRTQQLSNLIHEKKYAEAIELAIHLDQPYRILSMIKDLLFQPDGMDQLNTVIEKLPTEQLESLLSYMCNWNTNSKHTYTTQLVLSLVLKNKDPEELLEFANIKDVVQSLLPYTERHYKRVNQLVQQSMFINYTWESMKLADT